MPTKAYPLGEWLPDIPGGLQIAQNVVATAGGYAPVKGPQKVTPASNGQFLGAASFVDSTGNSTLLASDQGGISKYNGASWNAIASFAQTRINRYAQYGDSVYIALGSGSPIYRYQLIPGTAGVVGGAPAANDVAQTRDFVMAITTDNALQWCQFNDPTTWTTGVNQADKQPSLWGQLKRIVGGEYGIVLTDKAVVRATYVGIEGGLDIIWQFDPISQEIGCMAEGSVTNVGRLVFFLSERGFEMCDGQNVEPIADEKFNRWFFSQFSRSDIANIWSAIDPRNSLVLWGMPGTPGTIIAYNWVLKRATTFKLAITGMFSGYTSGISLDALDATYGNLDAIPISLDDPSLQGGNPVLLIADGSNALNALSGANLQADFSVENLEPSPGVRSRIRSVRLVSDTTQASATIDARLKAGDSEYIRSSATMRTNGKMPIRANGRYNTLNVTIPAGTDWSFIQGCELEFEPGDAR